ncbi:acyltransferase family protein [Ileibacterium valens]|uniref:acyltransferase family protein n=1 Tax=Ileibacterium valens TaxID=1862668 RepID=UPI00272D3733|nr:acyltransferase [Ileibacterium valens]
MVKAKQYAAVDIAKYVSALLVVAIHTYPFLEISETFNTLFIAIVCRLAVPFFFVSSGYFLFRKLNGTKKQNLNRLKKYLWRLISLYLVWTVIYIPYTIWNYMSEGFSLISLAGWIRDFFLNGSYYHLWFLPALITGTLIVYLIGEKKRISKVVFISMILYFIGYLINVYAPIWQSLPYVSIVYGFFTKTLVTARDGFFFAPIFIALGANMAKMPRPKLKASCVGFAASFLLLIIEVMTYYSLGILQDLSCMFLSLVPTTYFLMNLLLDVKMEYKPVYGDLRKDSTLIYVSHILFARLLLLVLPEAHLVVYLATLAFSSMFAFLVIRYRKQIPWLKNLM